MTTAEIKRILSTCEDFSFTKNFKETYYVDGNGHQISFGADEGCRSNDHRIIFSCFKDIDRDDWEKLIKRTGLLMIIPESYDAFTLKGKRLSKSQKQFIEEYGLNLIRE